MKDRLRFLLALFKDAVDRFGEVEGPRMGAAFSFYATFSIFPLVLLSVTVFGYVLGDGAHARERLLAAIAGDASIRQVVEQTLVAMQSSRSGRGLSFLVSLGTLLFGASGALTELEVALNRIWQVPPPKTAGVLGTLKALARDRLVGMGLVLAIGATLLASLVTSSVLGGLAAAAPSRLTPALLQTAEVAASLVLLTLVFSGTFHLLPRTRPPLRDVVGGAVLTTVGLTILKTVFASYLAHLTRYSAYGVVGGVLALATWIYLSSLIIFFGAQVTRVHCEMTGCRAAPPRPSSESGTTPDPARAPA